MSRNSRPDGASTRARNMGPCPVCGATMWATSGGALPPGGELYWTASHCRKCARAAGDEELTAWHERRAASYGTAPPARIRYTDEHNRAALDAWTARRRERLTPTTYTHPHPERPTQ